MDCAAFRSSSMINTLYCVMCLPPAFLFSFIYWLFSVLWYQPQAAEFCHARYTVFLTYIWKGKKVFIIATMGLFSGDGAGILARLLTKHGAIIIGGLHLKMPDSIGDEKALKRTLVQNQELVRKAEQKIEASAQKLKDGHPSQDGMGCLNHLAGLFGQRLYFCSKTKAYSDKLKIDKKRCIQCGKCASLCPMKNISLKSGNAVAGGKCTMCYRCVSFCPMQAITLLGKKVYEQCHIEKYL